MGGVTFQGYIARIASGVGGVVVVILESTITHNPPSDHCNLNSSIVQSTLIPSFFTISYSIYSKFKVLSLKSGPGVGEIS